MKKLINKADDFIMDMLSGLYAAYGKIIKNVEGNPKCMVLAERDPSKVGLVTGGGSGHLPLFLGYVGRGMLDGCAVGEVFQSPSSEDIAATQRAVDSGNGVLNIIGNYGGDKLNFKIASEELLADYGINTKTVIVADDLASGKPANVNEVGTRRGVAGIFFVYKCAGGAAMSHLTLDKVHEIAQRTAECVRTIGVALSPCTVPRVGKPSFNISDDEMEIGMGIHGEPGIRRTKLMTAKDTVKEMMDLLLSEGKYRDGDEVAVLVNGLGSTPLEELCIIYSEVNSILLKNNIQVYRVYIGEFATSLDMAGASISMLKLDEELKIYLDMEADTLFFKQVQ